MNGLTLMLMELDFGKNKCYILMDILNLFAVEQAIWKLSLVLKLMVLTKKKILSYKLVLLLMKLLKMNLGELEISSFISLDVPNLALNVMGLQKTIA